MAKTKQCTRDKGKVRIAEFTLALGIFSLGLLLSGCAGYRLGPTNGDLSGARSVQVNPFVNKTIEPRLGESVTTSVRRYIQRDGTYRLDTKNEGDIIVSGTIIEFQRSGLSFQPTDVVTPRDYWLALVAHVTAVDRGTGKVVLERNVVGRTTMRVGADLSSAERQATPLLAEDLARNITALLADGTW